MLVTFAFILPTHAMLLWGSALIASPIIIHLLNKRRFRTVSWAAMDFLFAAERTNRRRVNLEHLILLLLRCLLILLITLLVARPVFDSGGLGLISGASAPTERIIILDNSPSMGVRVANQTLFEITCKLLTGFVRKLARERPGDSVTLILTSRPKRPLVNGSLVAGDGAEKIVRRLQGVKISNRPAAYDQALPALLARLQNENTTTNRELYLVSDFRKRDWAVSPQPDPQRGLPRLLKKVQTDKHLQRLHLVNVLNGTLDNLAVTKITPPKRPLVVGIPARFQVAVSNYGASDTDKITVSLGIGGGFPQRQTLATLAPGETRTLPFMITFQESGARAVRASIDNDRLPIDDQRYFPAWVLSALKVLIVDGEPGQRASQSEAFYLRYALAPPGDLRSGYAVKVVTESQFVELPLADYQVIFLSNVSRFSEARVTAVKEWVTAGGGLVIALGDQIDAQFYEETLARAAPNLFPLRNLALAGDERKESWVHFSDFSPNHPLLQIFRGERNPFLSRIKIFRWWDATLAGEVDNAADGKVSLRGRGQVIARYSDSGAHPAMIETRVGEGRVLILTSPLDAEWSNWPSDPSFLITMQEAVRHLARPSAPPALLAVGEKLKHIVDAAVYSRQARLTPAGETEASPLQALPIEVKTTAASAAVPKKSEVSEREQFVYADTNALGFYTLALKKYDGVTEVVRYAVNLDASEGDLRAIPAVEKSLRQRLQLTAKADYSYRALPLETGMAGTQTELWREILLFLLLVLCVEQFVAWYFGQRRK